MTWRPSIPKNKIASRKQRDNLFRIPFSFRAGESRLHIHTKTKRRNRYIISFSSSSFSLLASHHLTEISTKQNLFPRFSRTRKSASTPAPRSPPPLFCFDPALRSWPPLSPRLTIPCVYLLASAASTIRFRFSRLWSMAGFLFGGTSRVFSGLSSSLSLLLGLYWQRCIYLSIYRFISKYIDLYLNLYISMSISTNLSICVLTHLQSTILTH